METLTPTLGSTDIAAAPALATATAAAPAPASSPDYAVMLLPLEMLHASEHVDATAVMQLAREIEASGIWTTPLPIEAATGMVMDGNHRLSVASRLGLRCLPCVLLSYDDPCVRVTRWLDGMPFERHELKHMAVSCTLLPYKSTRHRFDPLLPRVAIALATLR